MLCCDWGLGFDKKVTETPTRKVNFQNKYYSNKKMVMGRCKVIFESDIGWIFLSTSGNGGL